MESESAAVRLFGGGLYASFDWRLPIRSTELVLSAGFGAELVRSRAEAVNLDRARLSSGELDVVPAGRALGRYSIPWRLFRFFAGAGLDVPIEKTRYILQRADQPIVLFEPWPVRPFLLVGVATP